MFETNTLDTIFCVTDSKGNEYFVTAENGSNAIMKVHAQIFGEWKAFFDKSHINDKYKACQKGSNLRFSYSVSECITLMAYETYNTNHEREIKAIAE